MADKPNPSDIHAAIIFEDGKLSMIVPDEFEVSENQVVTWVITPPGHDAELFFSDETGSPFEWSSKKNEGRKIQGQARSLDQHILGKDYKYSVTAGGIKVDPHIRVKR